MELHDYRTLEELFHQATKVLMQLKRRSSHKSSTSHYFPWRDKLGDAVKAPNDQGSSRSPYSSSTRETHTIPHNFHHNTNFVKTNEKMYVSSQPKFHKK